MNIVVCVRQGLDGEISPFDASAYEQALRIPGGEVTLLSMGPPPTEEFLRRLTRLGARRAILLQDAAFAGSDTLATAYVLSLAMKQLAPELILCGRQTLVGDTGQTPPMLAQMCGYSLVTNAMSISCAQEGIICETRTEGTQEAAYPVVCTMERTCNLRLPGLRSRVGEVEVLSATALGAELSRCGLTGSPTRVLRTMENHAGRRKCTFISPEELPRVIQEGLSRYRQANHTITTVDTPLDSVWAMGEAVLPYAKQVGRQVTLHTGQDISAVVAAIRTAPPQAVLWGSDPASKRAAALVAAELGLGLCADCTGLDTEAGTLLMIRPALSGSVVATIKSLTVPAMATVRTQEQCTQDLLIAAGFGAVTVLDRARLFAERMGGELVTTRKMVDQGYLPYACQVGLTGRTVAPPVYVALGVSGAVHHLVGMRQAGTVIAVNADPKAPIFDYADYGIVADCADVL